MDNIDTQGISVVVPVYNEQDNVRPLILEIQTAMAHCANSEIVIVDDHSKDSTLENLQQLLTEVPTLKVVKHKRNMGQSAAVASGVRAASLPWIATLDGDGQNNPADIPALMSQAQQALQNGQQHILCMGYRQKRNDNIIRKLSSRIANGVRTFCLKDSCPDSGCGIKLFLREDFLKLPLFRNCHRFLPALFKRCGATVINVPVSHRERLRGESKYGIMNRLFVGIVDLIGVSWLMRRPIDVEFDHDITSS